MNSFDFTARFRRNGGLNSEEQPVSRKVTIKELAATLGVSIPTLRKYGECGLLGVDSVSGRTNLFDEAAAIARVEEINRLKSKGYSLSLIREKLEERPNGIVPLNLGLEGPEFTPSRHVLLLVVSMDEYLSFARAFIANGLRGSQAVLLVAPPDSRESLEAVVREEGFDVDDVRKSRQLTFAWYDRKLDGKGQVEALEGLLRAATNAGWQGMRVLGHPAVDPSVWEESDVHDFEERVSAWARKHPAMVVCAWMAESGSAQTLMQMQRNHREVVIGESVFVRS